MYVVFIFFFQILVRWDDEFCVQVLEFLSDEVESEPVHENGLCCCYSHGEVHPQLVSGSSHQLPFCCCFWQQLQTQSAYLRRDKQKIFENVLFAALDFLTWASTKAALQKDKFILYCLKLVGYTTPSVQLSDTKTLSTPLSLTLISLNCLFLLTGCSLPHQCKQHALC